MSALHEICELAATLEMAPLQELTKELPHQVLVSDSTRALLQGDEDALEFVDERDIRGKKERVKLWTLATAQDRDP